MKCEKEKCRWESGKKIVENWTRNEWEIPTITYLKLLEWVQLCHNYCQRKWREENPCLKTGGKKKEFYPIYGQAVLTCMATQKGAFPARSTFPETLRLPSSPCKAQNSSSWGSWKVMLCFPSKQRGHTNLLHTSKSNEFISELSTGHYGCEPVFLGMVLSWGWDLSPSPLSLLT